MSAAYNKTPRENLPTRIIGEVICKIYISLSTWTVTNFCEGNKIKSGKCESRLTNIGDKPILEYILQNSKILDPQFACTVLLQNSAQI
ncbi:hypothetical protein NQ317_014108 [Molorchus minor]|uniref:Uncharacterized protein n=1 Tax=Molorchus minor TaxID=1323400 RepID=A0ABQ9IU86_9CUCU|nr:hypothetical protein NQ317_014108 [Molorchus minor]